jgi:anti-sigma B factor antagonist
MKTRIIKLKRSSRFPGVVVVRLTEKEYGSNDETRLALVRRQLMDQMAKLDACHLVVDLSAVESFGARFIAILVSTWKELEKSQRRLALCGMSCFCKELIEVAQLHRLFDIYPTLQVALDEIEEAQAASEDLTLDLTDLLSRRAECWNASCSQAAVAC